MFYQTLMFIQWIILVYIYLLGLNALLIWLVHFKILDTRSYAVNVLRDLFYKLTDPLLRPIRKRIPNIGGLDFSMVIAIFFLILMKDVIHMLIINL
jgi:YggT family protein